MLKFAIIQYAHIFIQRSLAMTDYQIKILTLINSCKDPAKAELVALDCLTYLLEEHSANRDTVVVPPVKAS